MLAATDIGGTFTDLVLYVPPRDGRSGELRTAKVDTTPPEFERGIMNVLAKAGVSAGDLAFFAHGSTIVINALTERKGVMTALMTTAGFRDVLEIARGNRPDLFNLDTRKPRPFVERYLRLEINERTGQAGDIRRPPDLGPLPEMINFLKAEGVEAIAISFLHAYRNPENERIVAARIQDLWPEVSVVASHQISREWREYERTNTTVLSAYVHPVVKRYIERLERELGGAGFVGKPFMMQSNGGITSVEAASRNPVSMVESGPAGGILAARYLGHVIGEPDLIVLDIGGTTAKCALIEHGTVKISSEYAIEKTRKSPGYPIQVPVCEIVEIGNGGGSIAWLDSGGKLHVGPRSAGALPGPAAYGRGGDQATTTDANLLLGRIDPENFAGGEIAPDMAAVDRAFRPLAEALGMDAAAVARGIIRVANSNMVNALRLVSTNKGYDPREFALLAIGGGGPMHAVALARELRIPRVIVPIHSAVFSAWGMLLSDIRHDYIRTHLTEAVPDSAAVMAAVFDDMEQQAAAEFRHDAIEGAPSFEHTADLRYQGQEHTVKVPVPRSADGAIDLDGLIALFHETHERRFTYRLEAGVQIVNFHLTAISETPSPAPPLRAMTGLAVSDARLGMRTVDFDTDGIHTATIYDGLRLEPGMSFTGPAIVQEPSVTLLVPPGDRVDIDRFGNYLVTLRAEGGKGHAA